MVDIPRAIDLMYPTLEALKALGGSGTSNEIYDRLVKNGNYSNTVITEPHTDGRDTKFAYNSRWAKTYLKKMEAIENSVRGVWAITNIGKKLTEEEALEKYKEMKKKYNDKQQIKKQEPLSDNTSVDDEDDVTDEIYWQDELLDTIKNISPEQFERLSQRVLREHGFSEVKVTGRSNDGGIDGVGILRVNLISFQVVFQCKRYKDSVGSSVVRDFRGAMQGRADKGLIITTGSFTNEARKEATRDGAPAIDLIDGEGFCDLLKKLELGVSVEMVEEVNINKAFFEDF